MAADYPICSQVSWLELFLEQKLFLPMLSVNLTEQVKLCSGDGFSVFLPSHLLLVSSKLARRTFILGEDAQEVLLPSVRGSSLKLLAEILSCGMTSNLALTESMGDSLRDIREAMQLLDIPGCVAMMRVKNNIKDKFDGNVNKTEPSIRIIQDMAAMKVVDEVKLEIKIEVEEKITGTQDMSGSSKKMVEISTAAGPRECYVCKQMYPNWRAWKAHFRSVHREALFPCGRCGIKFVLEKTLEDHVFKAHDGEGIQCHYCDYTYRSRESLNNHMRKSHRADLVCCRFCSMRFLNRDTLRIHMKNKHKEKLFRSRDPRLRPWREKFVFSEKVTHNVKEGNASLIEPVVEEQSVQETIPQKPPAGKPVIDPHPPVPPSSLPPPVKDSSYPELFTTEPMTFYPTLEELANFEGYVAFMESQGAHKAGIARIVPPKEWTARKAGYDPSKVDIVINKPVKQNIATTQVSGAFTTFADRSIPPFTLPEYHSLATSPKYITPMHSSYEELEQLYWEQHQDPSSPSPIYGADIQATLTDPDQPVFNLTKLPSLISEMAEQVPGIHLPYVYIGMWKATFSWHVEDMDLYAINFLHHGAAKTWYCVPPEFGYKLEQLAQKLYPDMSDACFNLLRHKVVMIGPELLRMNGIPVNKMVHKQGTIMLLFPHAYHAGFNHGFNMAETLNFAMPRWVDYGKRFRGCLCRNQKREVRFDMEQFMDKPQPDKLEMWKNGFDFAFHPEDPEFLKKYWEDMVRKMELGFIRKEEFEDLKEELILKREIAPWFKKKFPLDYTDQIDLHVPFDCKDPLQELLSKTDMEEIRICHFQDPSELLQFVRKSEGRYYCNQCGFSHPSRTCTRNHVEAVHYPNTFSYHCDFCEEIFYTKVKLNGHKYKKHPK